MRLKRISLPKFKYRLYRAKGQSMQPTVRDGNLLFTKLTTDLDTGDIVIVPSHSIVKRVFSITKDGYHLFGDNHQDSSELIYPRNQMLYKVVWPRK